MIDIIFYYTGLGFWGVLFIGLIFYLWAKMPSKVKNVIPDLWLLIRLPFMRKENVTHYHNGILRAGDWIKGRWCYKPIICIINKKLTNHE